MRRDLVEPIAILLVRLNDSSSVAMGEGIAYRQHRRSLHRRSYNERNNQLRQGLDSQLLMHPDAPRSRYQDNASMQDLTLKVMLSTKDLTPVQYLREPLQPDVPKLDIVTFRFKAQISAQHL